MAGCPIIGASLSLRQGWDSSNLNGHKRDLNSRPNHSSNIGYARFPGLVLQNAVGSANRSFAIICSVFRAIEITSALNLAHNRHTGHREDQVSSGFKRSVIDRRNSGTSSRGEDATPPSCFQATLRCEPRRTSAPGTCSLRIAAALIASTFGRVS